MAQQQQPNRPHGNKPDIIVVSAVIVVLALVWLLGIGLFLTRPTGDQQQATMTIETTGSGH
jgi:hypothetical protein